MYDWKPKSARDILRRAQQWSDMGEDRTFIICGKPGPTGKTWLWDALRKAGHNAIEISEGIGGFVDYRDNENHMRDFGFGTVAIILNKPLDSEWKS